MENYFKNNFIFTETKSKIIDFCHVRMLSGSEQMFMKRGFVSLFIFLLQIGL